MASTDLWGRQGRWFKEFRTQDGLVWGLSQPSIMVQAEFGPDSFLWIAALAIGVSRTTGEKSTNLSDRSSASELANVLAHALGALQRHINVYASPRHQFRASPQDPKLMRWCLPSRNLRVTQNLWTRWATLLNQTHPPRKQDEIETLIDWSETRRIIRMAAAAR